LETEGIISEWPGRDRVAKHYLTEWVDLADRARK